MTTFNKVTHIGRVYSPSRIREDETWVYLIKDNQVKEKSFPTRKEAEQFAQVFCSKFVGKFRIYGHKKMFVIFEVR